MYKLRKGVTLPKEFKIKVNADESKALQEYLFSVGNVWNGKIGTQEVKHTELPFMYLENSKLLCDFYESKESFKKDKLPQIHFQDYFYLDFPEKWCIEVTEDNYKELDVWMHRNWKQYNNYVDSWKINSIDIGSYFHSTNEIKGGWGGNYIKSDDYTIITTDQFRGKFGNLKVHDVEFVKMGETKAKGTEPCEKEITVSNSSYEFGLEPKSIEQIVKTLKVNAAYYKDKSDRLRKEKFDLNCKIDDLNGMVNYAKKQIEVLKNNAGCKLQGIHEIQIKTLKDEIRQLKNIIAENNVTISKQRQEIKETFSSISNKNQELLNLVDENKDLHFAHEIINKQYVKKLAKIITLKEKVKLLSLR